MYVASPQTRGPQTLGDLYTVSILQSVFQGNTADLDGGAVFSDSEYGVFVVANSSFVGNTASGSDVGGGGISSGSADQQLCLGSLFLGNNAPSSFGGGWLVGPGVAVFQSGVGNATTVPCVFSGNTAVRGGGLAFLADVSQAAANLSLVPKFNLQNTNFTGNYASTSGGGLYLSGAPLTASGLQPAVAPFNLTMSSCNFINNAATGTGAGAEIITGATVAMSNLLMTGNAATGSNARGGALNVENAVVLSMINSTFYNNSAIVGTGASSAVQFGTPQTLSFGPGNGGAVFLGATGADGSYGKAFAHKVGLFLSGLKSSTTIWNNVFSSNAASANGGAMAVYNAVANVQQCIFTGNNATTLDASQPPTAGGALHLFGSTSTSVKAGDGASVLTNCTFTGNYADEGGALSVLLANAGQKVTLSGGALTSNYALRGYACHHLPSATLGAPPSPKACAA